MSLAVVASRALYGFQAQAVKVEVHVGPGLPNFLIVGLPDAGVRESRERVRSALACAGYEFPAGRITVNLAPADLPKDSGRFDLAIALGILLASGQLVLPTGEKSHGKSGQSSRQGGAARSMALEIRDTVFVGELSLTGELRSIKGGLAIAMALARESPGINLVMPEASAGVAAQVPGVVVYSARTLEEVVKHLRGLDTLQVAAPVSHPALEHTACLSDVHGQEAGRRALEIAASGGHSLLMCGAPGVGKSMLAQRLPGLLPPLGVMESLEVAALHGLAGQDTPPSSVPPFRAPHHTASSAAIIGGGAWPRPGEVSLAHHGVLFLDEMPEFQRPVLESLREPLEAGMVSIARARLSCSYPARFQLVAAMNPCPCGWAGHPRRACSCTPAKVEAYRRRLSGPLMDRIDLHVALSSPKGGWLNAQPGELSGVVRARVLACRERQIARQGCVNAHLDAAALRRVVALDDASSRVLAEASERWSWSARVVHRLLRVARTLADMRGVDDVTLEDMAEALQFRPGWAG